MGILLISLLLPRSAAAQTLKPEDIYQKLLPSVMTLHVENSKGETYIGTAFFALDKNTAVTAWHVVCDATKVAAKFSDERVVNVTGLIDMDEEHDLALIRLDGEGHPAATLCVANPPIGSRAYVIGAPKGFDFSITDGLVSQIQKIHGFAQYQVSCPISGGNSGGPVVNDRGEVIAITAWTKTDAQNLNFAIPASLLGHLNPAHSLVSWTESARRFAARAKTKLPASSADSVTVSEPKRNLSELKQLLNGSAGKSLNITVSDGDTEKQFSLVLPKDFVK